MTSRNVSSQSEELESSEDLEYVGEIRKFQERFGSINKNMQRMMKMMEKLEDNLKKMSQNDSFSCCGRNTMIPNNRFDIGENSDLRMNTISYPIPDLYLNPNTSPDPSPNLHPTMNPKSDYGLNPKLDLNFEYGMAMDEVFEGEHSDYEDENDTGSQRESTTIPLNNKPDGEATD
ncbi:hypothetical protein L6452_17928 [Arctium lappa]|uniref:Uncharacterized protein n=1 Tax=Arctium lappa TaxID=4217 RepID=A0ACB9C507_ARCLA|nr:hypothetical protein L6452_17928 [Arctium lappa]